MDNKDKIVAKASIKLTPAIRDSMLKEVHDVVHHNGLMTKIENLIESFDEYKKGKEMKEIRELKGMLTERETALGVRKNRDKERRRFWFMVVGFFLGNEIFWKYAIPFVERWITRLIEGAAL